MDSRSASSCWPCNRSDYGAMNQSIHDVVAATLAELGVPIPTDIVQTMLMRDGYFVGHKLRYNGGHAIWLAGGGAIEFYDGQGKLLKAIALEAEKGAAA
jgi:hypothetical protein